MNKKYAVDDCKAKKDPMLVFVVQEVIYSNAFK